MKRSKLLYINNFYKIIDLSWDPDLFGGVEFISIHESEEASIIWQPIVASPNILGKLSDSILTGTFVVYCEG